MTRRTFFSMFGLAAIMAPVARAIAGRTTGTAMADYGTHQYGKPWLWQCRIIHVENWGNCEIPVETTVILKPE